MSYGISSGQSKAASVLLRTSSLNDAILDILSYFGDVAVAE
jgi:hypothetical protein